MKEGDAMSENPVVELARMLHDSAKTNLEVTRMYSTALKVLSTNLTFAHDRIGKLESRVAEMERKKKGWFG